MAAFNFPNSPSTNDLHTENGVTFKWNGTIWLRVGNSYSDISTLNVSGISTFGGNIDANGDIDVDGHTNLDNVSVAGVTTFQGTVVSLGVIDLADKIAHASDSNTAIRFPANDTISAETGGSERLRIDSSGNIGIGIANPTKLLEVSSSSSPTIRINNSDTSISADQTIGVIEFKANDSSNDGSQVTGSIESISQAAFTGQGSPSYLIFKTNGVSGANALSERLRINSAGDLKLNQTQSKINLNTSDGSDNKFLSINGGGDASQSRGAGITWYGNEVGSHEGRLQLLAGNSGSANGVVQMHTGGAERLRIDSSGRVLIGTTTEGTPTYGEQLTIANSGTHCGMTIRSATSGAGSLYFSDGTSGDSEYRGYVEYHHSSDFFKIATAATERVRISNNGHVLIGDVGNDNAFFKAHAVDGAADDLYVGQFINAEATAGRNYGVNIQGGSNSTDHGLRVKNHAGTSQFLVRGDGKIGVNRTANMTTWFDINHGSTSSPETNLMLSGSSITTGGGTGIFLKSSSNTTLNRYGTRIHSIREAANNGASSLVISNELLDASGLDEVLRINSNGEMGLGVIPKAWKTGSDFRALQVGTGLAVVGRGSGDEDRGGISVNHYINTSDTAKYIAGGHANYLYMNDGRYDFRTAASGSADGTISWTTPLQITASGLVGINQNPQVSKLEISHNGTNSPVNQIELNTPNVSDGGGSGIFFKNSGATGSSHTNRYGTRLHTVRENNGASVFRISNEKTGGTTGLTEAFRIDADQRVFKPQQPRFCIVGGNNLYNNSESNIWNNTHAFAPSSSVNGGYGTSIQCNVGNHYNTSNGRWTVPIAGAYYFFFYGTTGSNHSHFVYITKNGSSIANDLGLEYSQGEYHQNFAGSYLINCASGDYMNFYRRGSGYNFYSLVWGGWLVA